MAYVVPIHRPSSARHAIKLNLLDAEEECLVVAKANRVEIWVRSAEGLTRIHTKSIHGRIAMLQKVRPAHSSADHLFIGTERFQYFTARWDSQTRQLDTVQSFVDVSERHMRDSQSLDRCSVDPSGRYLVMELFEGVLNVVKVVKPKRGANEYLGEPEQVRITELFIRSSTFLHTSTRVPKFAILYEDNSHSVRLATYRLTDEKGNVSNFDPLRDRENEIGKLDEGANLLIPVPKGAEEQKRYIVRNAAALKAELGGVLVVGETKMLYLDDESKAMIEYAYDAATIFVAWAQHDERRFFLADDYGNLHILTLLLDGATLTGMDMFIISTISKPSQLVYMGNDILYVASHEGNSQVIQVDLTLNRCEVLQTFPNIAPILDFTIMDMGSRANEAQTNEYSSGQARIVTGSGAFVSGSLRSVRSGVGLEDLGLLGEMENIRAVFSFNSNGSFGFVDTLVISLLTETRVIVFDSQGEAEEKEELLGMALSERTILARNVSEGRILQITASTVMLIDADSGVVASSWQPADGESITAASANDGFILLSSEGKTLVSLNIASGLSEIAKQSLDDNDQVACVHIPSDTSEIGLVGFWQSGSVSTVNIANLEVLHTDTVRPPNSAAIPRSIVLTQMLPESLSGPTLLVAMSDGIVLTFNMDKTDYSLSGKKSVVLGVQQATLQVLPRDDGLTNVFATCEHSSLIYGSEGRIVYSAVTAEDAICVCPFDSEFYPDAIVLATAKDIRISQIDSERRTHVKSLHVGQTVRRIAYSPAERVFGIGIISKTLQHGEEIISSGFRLVDEVALGELGKPYLLEMSHGTELIESVIRAELRDSYGELVERFIVGTSFLDTAEEGSIRGRIIVFGIDSERSPYEIVSYKLKGACRCLAMLDGKIVAALVKTVVVFTYTETTSTSATLEKTASYRTSTCPIDMAITGKIIAVADMMKSVSLVEYRPGKEGLEDELVEVARHFQSCWGTAVSHVEGDTFLESDADGNLIVLRRNPEGVTLEDRKRLEVTSEMNLGEMVNRIRKVNVDVSPDAAIVPQAFLATTEGSIYLFGTIVSQTQDLLMRLQARMADVVQSPGHLPFNRYRSFKNAERETDEPFRFVDGELIERFLDVSEVMQEEICRGLGPSVEDLRDLVEELKRLH
ncbi:MAG: hypothetical protein M1818_006173 [Claussenomyces sp. TS43310]|nr:MAG: hypothetical protein M1818_006173 [Claussenomyces sp. TS43310]